VKWIARAAVAGLALGGFLWLVSESTDRAAVLLLAAGLVMAAGIRRATQHTASAPQGARRAAAASTAGFALAGLVPVVAAALMVVKVALHSHGQPDFTTADVVGVVARVPSWAVGGALLGAAVGLFSSWMGHATD
jgi:hypothetical protein